MKKAYRVMSSWKATLITAFLVASWWMISVLPPGSFWLEPESMLVADFEANTDASIIVLREIKRPVFAEWSAKVRKLEDNGWVIYCVGSGSGNYSVDSALPEPLRMSWWFERQCEFDAPGQYYIDTTWTVYPLWTVGRRVTRPLISNVFRVTEPEGVHP